MALSTKEYNDLVATVGLQLPVEQSGVPPGPDRDETYARLVAARETGKTVWPISD